MISIGFVDSSDNHPDTEIAALVEAELPGFWARLKQAYPKFASVGAPDGPPIGYLYAFEVHEAMIAFLPIYIAELKACA